MIRGLLFFAIAACIAAPAAAGERNAVTPISGALPTLIVPVPVQFPGHDGALTFRGDVVVRLRSATPFDIAATDPLATKPLTLISPYAMIDLHALKAWRITDKLAPTTNTAGGFYAVRDGLADHRKPRAFRPSALGAMLVLRIDGKDESAPFSIGGGGVAAALWRAVPQ